MSIIQHYNQIHFFNRYTPFWLKTFCFPCCFVFFFFLCIEVTWAWIFDVKADLYKAKHPLIICTDDFGVFSTTLSNEYSLAVRSFGEFLSDSWDCCLLDIYKETTCSRIWLCSCGWISLKVLVKEKHLRWLNQA